MDNTSTIPQTGNSTNVDDISTAELMKIFNSQSPQQAPSQVAGVLGQRYNPPTPAPGPNEVGNAPYNTTGYMNSEKGKAAKWGNLAIAVSNMASKFIAQKAQEKNKELQSKMQDALKLQEANSRFTEAMNMPGVTPEQKKYFQDMINDNTTKLTNYAKDPKFSKAFVKATSQDLVNPDKKNPESAILTGAINANKQQDEQKRIAAQQAQQQPKAPVQTGSQPGLPGTTINPQPATKPAAPPMQGGSQPGLPGTGINPVPITRTAQPNVQGQVQNRAAVMPSMGFPQQTAPAISGAPIINPNQPAPTNAQASGQQASANNPGNVGHYATENPAYAAWVKQEEEFKKTERELLKDLITNKLKHQDKMEEIALRDSDALSRMNDEKKFLLDKMSADHKFRVKLQEQLINKQIALAHEKMKSLDRLVGAEKLKVANEVYKETTSATGKIDSELKELIKRRDAIQANAGGVLVDSPDIKPDDEQGRYSKEFNDLDLEIQVKEHNMGMTQHILDNAKKVIAEVGFGDYSGAATAYKDTGVYESTNGAVSENATTTTPTELPAQNKSLKSLEEIFGDSTEEPDDDSD